MKKSLFFVLLLFWAHISAQNYAAGLNFDEEAYAATPLKKAEIKRSYDNLPAKIDLKPYCPTPQKQGMYSTCVGWALGYAACTITEGVVQNSMDKNTLNSWATSPDFIYAVGKLVNDTECKRGIPIDGTLAKLKGKLMPRKKDFNALCTAPNALPKIRGKGVIINDFARLFNENDLFLVKLLHLKKALSNKKPVVIGIKYFSSFKNAKSIWTGEQDLYQGGHAVCIVGYDDDIEGGVVEIMNSWGEEWGEKGFTKIKYAHLESILKSAYELKIEGQAAPTPPSVSAAENAYNKTVEFVSNVQLKLTGGTEMRVKIVENETKRGLKPVKEATNANIQSQYQTVQSYPSGTRYRVYVTLSEPTYLYVLGSDLTYRIAPLFPPDGSISPYISSKNATIALPDEKWSIEMDDTKGTDFMFLLYSKTPLDISTWVNNWNAQNGSAFEKIHKTVGMKALPTAMLNLATGSIGFKTALRKDNFVFLSLEIGHH